MTPPEQGQEGVAYSDGEYARLKRYADHTGLSVEEAQAKLGMDALIKRVVPSRCVTPGRVIAFTRRLHALK